MARRPDPERSALVERGRPQPALAIAGVTAAVEQIGGREVDWCRRCGHLRYRGDMRWLVDVYGCRGCLGHEGTTGALWMDPWKDPADWGKSTTVRG